MNNLNLFEKYVSIQSWYKNTQPREFSLDPSGSNGLKKELIKYYNYQINEKNILITSGVTEAIALAALAFIEEGDRVLTFDPYFYLYELVTEWREAIFETISYQQIFEVENFDNNNVSLFYYNNPHNPTGCIYELDTLIKIKEHIPDAIIFCDEVYSRLNVLKKFQSAVSLLDDKLIIADSVSKNYNSSHLRIGWLIATEENIKKLELLHYLLLFSVPVQNQKNAVCLLKHKHIDKSHLKSNYFFVKQKIKKQYQLSTYHGTNYIVVFSDNALKPETICEDFNKSVKENVIMPLTYFSKKKLNGIRVNLNASKNIIERLTNLLNEI